MQNPTEPKDQDRSLRFSWLGKTSLAGILLAAIAVVIIQQNASATDFAFAKIMSAVLALLCWMLLTAACWASNLPRSVWRRLLYLPVAALAVFLAIYRLERVDGELTPKFVFRFGTATSLVAAPSQANAIDAKLLEPSLADYPQFLGPNRDGHLSTVLSTDWQAEPPKIAWKQTIGEGWSSFAVVGDVAITMEQREAQEWVVAYNVVDGAILWHYALTARHTNTLGGTGPRSTPTISGDLVFACSAVDQIVCLELSTGNLFWSHSLLEGSQSDFESSVSWGRSASPLVVDNLVVIPMGGHAEASCTLLALDKTDGSVVWKSGTDEVSYSSPTLMSLHDTRQIVYTSESKLAAYAIDDGRELWSIEAPSVSSGAPNVAQPVLIPGNRVLLTKGYGEGARLLQVTTSADQKWSVQEIWKSSALRTKFTTCVYQDGYAYGLSDGVLECVDTETGKSQWKKGRYHHGQLLLVGSHLLITSEKGELVLVDASPNKWNEVAKLQVIGDVSWNTPALSGNRLLMRNSDEAACVTLPVRMLPAPDNPVPAEA